MRFSAATPKNPILIIACSMLCFSLIVLPRFTAGQEKKAQEKKEQEKKEQKKTQEQKAQEQTVKITEEILVVGKAPKEQPVSTVTRIDFTKLEQNKPLDLSEAIRYAPGVNVTFQVLIHDALHNTFVINGGTYQITAATGPATLEWALIIGIGAVGVILVIVVVLHLRKKT